MMFVRNRIQKSHCEDSGFVTAEFIAGASLLLLPVTLLVMTLPTWWERVDMSRVASREAARTYVLTGDAAQSQQVVTDIRANYSIPNNDMTLVLSGDPKLPGGTVTAKVTTEIPALQIPIWNINALPFNITTSHNEAVDLYRSAS